LHHSLQGVVGINAIYSSCIPMIPRLGVRFFTASNYIPCHCCVAAWYYNTKFDSFGVV